VNPLRGEVQEGTIIIRRGQTVGVIEYNCNKINFISGTLITYDNEDKKVMKISLIY
jgi:hypothetical protein